MNNILVVNVNWLGDAVFSLPVFSALRMEYPNAHIACLCVPRVAEVLRYSPDVNEVLVMDEQGRHFWPWQKAMLIWQLRSKRFDIALVLHRSVSRAMIVWLAGIKERVGFCKWPLLMTRSVPNKPQGAHRMDHYLTVIESLGICPSERLYRLNAPRESLPVGGEYVVFNTGGNWDLKQWPKKFWVGLAEVMKQHCVRVVFTGSGKDHAAAEEIMETSGVDADNLCGSTTLGQSLAVYARSIAVISADSGPLHLANSVGARVIGLFGPTRSEITGPRGTGKIRILFHDIGCNRTPCYHLGCVDNQCMKGISVHDVFEAYKELIR